MSFSRRDIWRMMKVEAGVNPTAATAAQTINGAAVDCTFSGGGGESVVLHAACGAATGAPSAQTVDAKIQDSADGSTGWADVGDAITQLTADDTGGESPGINLSTLNRFLRVVLVVALTAGTAPTIPVHAVLVIGGRD